MLFNAGIGVAVVFCFASAACAQGTLIPDAQRRDHVFDVSESLLYYTNSSGELQRYNLETRGALPSIPVGFSLGAVDVTPNGAWAFVTDRVSTGPLHRVDLATGQIATVIGAADGQSWDVAMLSDSRGFLTNELGSTFSWLRQVNAGGPTTEFRTDIGLIERRTSVVRSADGSTMMLIEPDSSTSGPIRRYDLATDSFGVEWNFQTAIGAAALSHNGGLLAIGLAAPQVTYVFDSDFVLQATLPRAEGLVFDPVRDLMYAVNSQTDEILAYRTTDWTLLSRIPIGENVDVYRDFDDGVMSMSADGDWLALSTPMGIRVFQVPGAAAAGPLLACAAVCRARRRAGDPAKERSE